MLYSQVLLPVLLIAVPVGRAAVVVPDAAEAVAAADNLRRSSSFSKGRANSIALPF